MMNFVLDESPWKWGLLVLNNEGYENRWKSNLGNFQELKFLKNVKKTISIIPTGWKCETQSYRYYWSQNRDFIFDFTSMTVSGGRGSESSTPIQFNTPFRSSFTKLCVLYEWKVLHFSMKLVFFKIIFTNLDVLNPFAVRFFGKKCVYISWKIISLSLEKYFRIKSTYLL